MEKNMTAYCGTYCGVCEWRERTGCPGCRACAGEMFWGVCDKARCCMERGLDHCGQCPDLPCRRLLDLFADPEHGDGGERLFNLKSWANGEEVYRELRKPAETQN